MSRTVNHATKNPFYSILPKIFSMKQILGVIAILFFVQSYAQEDNRPIIQFSGYVITPDSLMGIPFVNIYKNNSSQGTMSNPEGFFSLVAQEGDTIHFSSIGFEQSTYVVPDDLQTNKYSILKLLTQDIYFIDSVVIYPWPTKDMFRQAFLSLELEESDVDRALKNLEREYLKEIGEAMPMDGNENANLYLRTEAQKYYYAGQAPPQNIFNVFAWAQFIEAWKRGDFKRKKNK